MNLLVLVSSMLLTACAAGTEPEEFEDVASEDIASAEQAISEGELPVPYYSNYCDGGTCYVYSYTCVSLYECTITILFSYVQP